MPEYERPQSLVEALRLMAVPGWQILAGATDIFPATQRRDLPQSVMDVTGLAELQGVQETAAGLRIGACTTWSQIAAAPLPASLRALQQAAVQVGGRQIQNAGTIGGNLCNASPAADGVPPLLVLDAELEMVSLRGSRHIALADFLIGPRQTARAADEVLVAIHLPRAGLDGQSRFLKLGARAYLVISIAMVAVRLHVQQGQVRSAALAVGACSATARRLPMLEKALTGAGARDASSAISDQAVAAALSPMNDLRATAYYRAKAAAELLRRAVADAVGVQA